MHHSERSARQPRAVKQEVSMNLSLIGSLIVVFIVILIAVLSGNKKASRDQLTQKDDAQH